MAASPDSRDSESLRSDGESSDGTVEEEEEEFDCYCTCAKGFFGFLCIIYLFFCISVAGVTCWCIGDNQALFTAGTSNISYGFLAYTVFGFVICLIGVAGLVMDGFYITGVHLLFHGVMIALQTGLIVAAHLIYPTPEAMVDQAWSEMSFGLREFISSQLRCCGLDSYNDTYTDISSIPDACRSETNHLYTDGCGETILTHYSADGGGLPALIAVVAAIGLLQILVFATGSAYFCQLRSLDDSEESFHGRSISPLISKNNRVSPLQVQQHEEVTHAQARSQPSTSRRDVTVGVGTPKPEQKAHGNEALFSVAGVMLQQ